MQECEGGREGRGRKEEGSAAKGNEKVNSEMGRANARDEERVVGRGRSGAA